MYLYVSYIIPVIVCCMHIFHVLIIQLPNNHCTSVVFILYKKINKIAKHKNLWFSIWSLQDRWLISIIFLDWFASINLNDTELDFLLHLQFCLAGQSLIIQTGWEIDTILDPVIIWMNWVLWFSLWCMHSLPWTNMLAWCGWELHAALRQGE